MRQMNKVLARLVLAVLLAISVLPQPTHADLVPGIVGVGIMGDSASDEYRADDNRAPGYAATTLNWMEQLVKARGINFGRWGTWGGSRRTGYEYNWARSGAVTHDIITTGQLSGLTQQVRDGKVSHVFLYVGANDFARWNGTYAEIYDGTLSDAEVQAKVDGIIADLSTAVDTVMAAGPVKVAVTNFADRVNVPVFVSAFPDPAGRQRVTNAILQINQRINGMKTTRPDLTVIDLYNFGTQIMSDVDAYGNWNVGGELITLAVDGDEPHHAMLGDSEHVGTVMGGRLANFLFFQTFNSAFGFNLTPFSDEESLQLSGIHAAVPPQVSVFAATPAAVEPNQTAQLSWNVAGAAQILIDHGIGLVPAAGTADVTVASSTTYTMTARFGSAVTTRTATVLVNGINQAPTVNAGSDLSAFAGQQATLRATVADDGLPIGSTLNIAWLQVDGPAPVTLSSPASATTGATFSVPGVYTLRCAVNDGALAANDDVTVTVSDAPDTTAPTVSITSPLHNGYVSGTVIFTANASDDKGVAGVQFIGNGNQLIGPEDTEAPYTSSADTTLAPDGDYTITARARDAAGNVKVSQAITMKVRNYTPVAYVPVSYSLVEGTPVSGNLSSLTSDNNVYLRLRSVLSGAKRAASVQMEFTGIHSLAPSSVVSLVRLKSSLSSTGVNVQLFNYSTGSWETVQTATVGTTETALQVTKPGQQYVSPQGTMKLQVVSSRSSVSSSYDLYVDFSRLTVTK